MSVRTHDRDAPVAFVGETLGSHHSGHMPERHVAEFDYAPRMPRGAR